MLQLKNIYLSREEPVLSGFSLVLPAGETMLLCGPSGAGKTSVFHLILGFVQPESGTVMYRNTVLSPSTVSWFRRNIGYLPQNPLPLKGNLYENFNKIFSFSANRSGMPDRRSVEERLSLLGLKSYILDKNTQELSGGQKQKAALVMLSFLNRSLNLLDEPLSAMDPDSILSAAGFIRKYFPHSLIISHIKEPFQYSAGEVCL